MQKQIKENLLKLSDKKYKEFQSNLCPETNNIIGVRIPILRDYAKKLTKEYEIEQLLKVIDDEYCEETMLKGILIGLSKKDFNKIKIYMEKFIPKINNWAICDVFCSSLKIAKKNKEEMWEFIQKYLKSDKEFEIIFSIVMILNYYIDDKSLQANFHIFDNIKSKKYYVQMAIAWAISICLIKYYDETIQYLKKSKLDKFTYNKAIQKAIESYRINNEQKDFLRKMKK